MSNTEPQEWHATHFDEVYNYSHYEWGSKGKHFQQITTEVNFFETPDSQGGLINPLHTPC